MKRTRLRGRGLGRTRAVFSPGEADIAFVIGDLPVFGGSGRSRQLRELSDGGGERSEVPRERAFAQLPTSSVVRATVVGWAKV